MAARSSNVGNWEIGTGLIILGAIQMAVSIWLGFEVLQPMPSHGILYAVCCIITGLFAIGGSCCGLSGIIELNK